MLIAVTPRLLSAARGKKKENEKGETASAKPIVAEKGRAACQVAI